MNEKIFLIDNNYAIHEMEAQDYPDEDRLQRMLVDHPDLLAGYQINEEDPRRWMLVAREMGLPDADGGSNRWSVDHLFLDQDGVPTLVEVKRASDTRIRREVVGQMLDYAANALLHWPIDTIRRSFEATCRQRDTNPDSAVAGLLQLPSEGTVVESYWSTVEGNLQARRLRLLFLADRIPVELRRIIEFLNEQMTGVEVLGIELRQFGDGHLQAIVPRVIGKTTAAEKVKEKASVPRAPGRQWDEPSFFEALEANCGPEDVPVARAIIDWARRKRLREWWGKGRVIGSFVPVCDAPSGSSHSLFAIWTSGGLEFYFQYHLKQPPFEAMEKRLELMDRLNAIPGISIQHSALDKRPNVYLSIFRDQEKLEKLLATYEWFIEQVDIDAMSRPQ